MTTLNQITARLKQIASNHRQVRTVREDDPVNFLQNENKDVEYPVCWFTFNGSQLQEKEISYNYVVTLATRVNNEDYNEMEAMSDMELITRDIIGQIDWDKQPWDFDRNVTFEFFREDYEDNLAGVVFQVNLSVPFNYDVCDVPSGYELPDNNGVYINTNRFMTVYDFIVGTGQPLEDGETELINNQFVVPPFVFIGGQLITYQTRTDRRYITHDATTKKITINNGGVLNDEHVFIII